MYYTFLFKIFNLLFPNACSIVRQIKCVKVYPLERCLFITSALIGLSFTFQSNWIHSFLDHIIFIPSGTPFYEVCLILTESPLVS